MSKKTAKKTEAAEIVTIKFMDPENWVGVKAVAMDENRETSRSAFIRHIRGFDGKPAADWMSAVAKAPPAFSKGKNPYTAKQWITWFAKVNIVQLKIA